MLFDYSPIKHCSITTWAAWNWSRVTEQVRCRPFRWLAQAGSRERIAGASLEQQYQDAIEAGDKREAARLEYREPGMHIGPRGRGQWRTAIRSLKAPAQTSERWRGRWSASAPASPKLPGN